MFLALLVLFIYVLAVSNITTLHKAYLAFHSLMMIWPLCHFFMHLIPNPQFQWALVNIAFLGLSFLGFGWFVFALLLTDRISGLTKKALYLLSLPAVFSSLLVTTNPWHFLFSQPGSGGWTIRTYGPFFWLFFSSIIFYITVATAMMVRTRSVSAEGNTRRQLSLCLKGVVLLISFSLLDILFNVILYPRFGVISGLTSLGIIFSAVCFVIAIQKHDLFKIVTIARREVIDSMATGLIVVDQGNLVLDINSSAAALLNIPRGQLFDIGKMFSFLDRKGLNNVFVEEYNTSKLKILQTEIIIGESQARHLSITVSPVLDGNKNFLGRIITLNDITQFHQLLKKINEKNEVLQEQNKELIEVQQELYDTNRKLKEISIKDDLTDCYNKRYFLQHLIHEIQVAARYKSPFSIILFDLDNFKRINDTYGHLIGDDVLCSVVDSVKRTLRSSDLLARFGGEEFIVYLPRTDNQGAVFLAERIRFAIQNHPISISEKKLTITISAGLVSVEYFLDLSDSPEILLEDILVQADRALYRAKANGRNCVVDAGVR